MLYRIESRKFPEYKPFYVGYETTSDQSDYLANELECGVTEIVAEGVEYPLSDETVLELAARITKAVAENGTVTFSAGDRITITALDDAAILAAHRVEFADPDYDEYVKPANVADARCELLQVVG